MAYEEKPGSTTTPSVGGEYNGDGSSGISSYPIEYAGNDGEGGYQVGPGATGNLSAGGEYDNLDTADSLSYTNLAAQSAGEAALSAAEAALSADEAAQSLSEIGTSVTQAAASATSAANSATSASNSATSAANSATSASTSATTATTKAAEAVVSATNAATSATTATTQASAASASATSASTSASTATTKASEAATSATNAASSASTATTKASEASASASSAASSAATATTQAANAVISGTNAANSASAASTSASNAATSATAANTSATNSASSATSASNSATIAVNNANAAGTSATNAATSASTATTQATNAAASATSAAGSATTATTKAAEAVTSANDASSSASLAATSATSASTSATNAATSATSASGSATTATTKATEAAASALAASTSETNAATSASTATTQATNAATSATSASNSATSASGSAATATTQAANASTSATNAANSSTSAGTSATNAANSASSAATSATAASTSATNAATSATSASTSATNANTSATSAISAQAAAEAARDQALAAFDNFDDKYLGEKAVAPTVDNDGNPLQTGALYFNTVSNSMKVYSGTAWLDAYASLSGALLSANNLNDLSNVVTARSNLGLGTAATTNSTEYATAAQGTLADNAVSSITSVDGSVVITTTGTAKDLSVTSTTTLISQVRNETGATLTKGTVVYISGAAGNKALVSKALASADATSAQTYGVVQADIANNNNGYVVIIGVVSGLDTSTFTEGVQLYLSGTTAGGYTSIKPYAPIHLVYVGVVTRSHANQGTIEVKIQNGYEMDELHDVSAQSPSNGDTLVFNSSTSLWTKTPQSTLSVASAAAVPFSGVTSKPTTLSGYGITDAQATLVSGTNIKTVNGNSVLGSGNIQIDGGVTSFNTRTGAISLSSGDVTGALGFTPYNSTNPSGYITNAALSPYLLLAGGTMTGAIIGGLAAGSYGINLATNDNYAAMRVINNPTAIGTNSDGMYIGYQNGNSGITRIFGGGASSGGIVVNGSGVNNVTIAGNIALNAGNYNSYSPTLTGGNASGTWGINISGNAATATSATDSTKLPLAGGTLTGTTTLSVGRFYVSSAASGQVYNGTIHIRDAEATGANNSFAGIAFSSTPGADYVIGKYSSSGTGYLEIRNHLGTSLWRMDVNGAVTQASTMLINNGADLIIQAASGSTDSGDIVFRNGSGVEVHRLWDNGGDGLSYRFNAGTAYKLITAGNYSSYALPLSGGTLNGVLTINSTSDNQILLQSADAWTGIGFDDAAASATDYIWHNGGNSTFAIGGGGSNVSGKKLHVHGGVTIGSGLAATSVSTNGLLVETRIDAPIFYDSNNTGYYVDPNSTSRMVRIDFDNLYYGPNSNYGIIGTSGYFDTVNSGYAGDQLELNYVRGTFVSISHDSMRAPLFYDYDNTGYYCDPASTSNLNQVNLQGFLRRNTSAAGYLEGNYGSSTDANSSACIYTIGGAYQPGTTSLGNMYGIGYTVGNGTANPGLGATGWGLYVAAGGTSRIFLDGDVGYGIASNSWRAPIFYDSNNTGYYVDPSSTSNVSGDFIVNQSGYAGIQLKSTTGTQSLWIRTGWNGAPTPSVLFNNVQFQSSGSSGGSFTFWSGNTLALTITSDYAEGAGSLRAPIFYDSNNTGYYVDPASTSRMGTINADSLYSYGNVTAYSDERLKTDWEVLPTDFVEKLAKVKSGTYTRIDSGERQVGVGAQSLQAILKEAVSDSQEYLGVNYGNAALASAVELAKEVVDLKTRVAELEALINKLIKE